MLATYCLNCLNVENRTLRCHGNPFVRVLRQNQRNRQKKHFLLVSVETRSHDIIYTIVNVAKAAYLVISCNYLQRASSWPRWPHSPGSRWWLVGQRHPSDGPWWRGRRQTPPSGSRPRPAGRPSPRASPSSPTRRPGTRQALPICCKIKAIICQHDVILYIITLKNTWHVI